MWDELRSEIGGLREELRSEIAGLREDSARIRVEMAARESRLMRWMFVFWIGQLAAILGVVFVVLRA
ncbi:MAG: hypothetical protein GWN32_09080 [Gemmatimonadetes bacterium]|nr:hypothetical protein [Gemmatimonadota bacterium]NIR89556.1 hypothetical protein [Gammaproteobacteria bacterium]NIT68608.1 hypothetical protein [Gemmatimonadota bacterium]NIU52868.1 hypothetical protein [Gemmatimonadota bacterium]NIW36666.1 hypothetical protein [Gemmatimonadota bacterium]